MPSELGDSLVKVHLNPSFSFFFIDNTFDCELAQTLLLVTE